MTGVTQTVSSGDAHTDGVLCGTQWSGGKLTYSFPTDSIVYGAVYGNGELTHNFGGLLVAQQQAIRNILGEYAQAAQLSLQEVSGSAVAGADLRFARSSAPPTCWTYTPGPSNEAGDVWLGARSGAFDAPVRGGYAWLTLTHETGLSLGFKDAFQDPTNASWVRFGAEPADHDSTEYTVSSYRSYVGAPSLGGYLNGAWDFPQTLMLDDIAAIQHLYGVNFDHAGQSVVYSWSAVTGELSINGVGQGAPGGDRIFQTIWTAGSHAVYDLSNYAADLHVDLRPGAWSTFSTDQLAHLDGLGADTHRAQGNVANAYYVTDGVHDDLVSAVIGGSGNDTLIGNDADNVFTGGAKNDVIDGGAGRDVAVYSGRAADYAWTADAAGAWTIRDLRAGAPDGVDTLKSIEVLRFADGERAIDAPQPVQPATQPAAQAVSPAASAPLLTAQAYQAILYTTPADALAAPTDAAGQEAWLGGIIHQAAATTSVVTTVYAFFTGATPSQGGMTYLLDPHGPNPNNLNSAAYAGLSIDDRYINLAVSLGGSTAGEGFQKAFAGLSLTDAYVKAFDSIYGATVTSDFADAQLTAAVEVGGVTQTRADYLRQQAGGGDVAVKAALAGWLIGQAVQTDTGSLAAANDAYLHDLVTGAHFGVDLVGGQTLAGPNG